LITGASRGIGRATALLLAQRGQHVVLAARDAAALQRLAAEIQAAGGSAQTLPMDLTDDASVEAALKQLLDDGGCDIVINNAAVCEQAEFLTQTPAVLRAEMELNYWGVLRVTHALLPSFVRRRSGMIVNVSSLVGSIACTTTANYSASKAAVEAFSRALRGEVARFGVKVVVFVAPHTRTEMQERTTFDGVPALPVTYTASELVRAMELEARTYVASPVYRSMLWFARLFPQFMEARVHASTRSLLQYDPPAA
jgi:short-subunit dehydrogenase